MVEEHQNYRKSFENLYEHLKDTYQKKISRRKMGKLRE